MIQIIGFVAREKMINHWEFLFGNVLFQDEHCNYIRRKECSGDIQKGTYKDDGGLARMVAMGHNASILNAPGKGAKRYVYGLHVT